MAGEESRPAAPVVQVPDAGPAPTSAVDVVATIARVGVLLRARGERMTRARRAVLDVLARDGGHLGAEEVVARVAGVVPGVHRATVYRTLDALGELGVVQHVHVRRTGTAYHLAHGGREHLHAECRRCGAVQDLPADLLDGVAGAVVRDLGFVVEPTHVALSGLCASCATPDARTVSARGGPPSSSPAATP
ncbi:Fur family transcriptional regulator [Cellulomonas wangsupingiae]|uniref:Transcriptional repressor n=1 Tax=Cellulomonas wangsupingiae TaxID=2968085 RepID=A0ABY5K414_9CELL|nr:Fur family transcriptional regulator [Cellulomonas wangsupingiae]MCC2336076.1 transcriptional repressor [Cellulomonas wangsupingiae]MCM0639614.1 transcriptional repressor [Cellulomonas wangsupingiae]UUI64798.1 transcriptional repressor [Cellulomonas wangsupingiae]